MIAILTNPRQVTLSLSRTRNGPMDQRPEAGNRQQHHRAREIGRRRCDSIQTRRCDYGMTRVTTTITTSRRRRRSCRVTTWLVPVHLCLSSFDIHAISISLSKQFVLVLRDGTTHAAESDVDRLGHFSFEANAVSDRMPSHLGLHLLLSVRHLNFPLLALSRDIETIGTAFRYDDIQHDRIHTFTFTFICI